MASLPGIRSQAQQSPITRSHFRSSWTQPEGAVGSFTFEAVITDVNLVNWTVDVSTKFDQKTYLGIQVGSPYMHFNRGEGIYVMPDIGAKCHVTIPSDGPPPYVSGFIMPQETLDGSSTDAPAGTDGSKGGATQESTTASFAGGRTRAKPGDIYLRNRDGSFVTLHRGGTLQIGATSLAQRIYIPLQNLVNDISENYLHQNTGGSVNWFVAYGESGTNPPTVSRHTYRLLANDQKATVRVSIGKLSDVIAEPDATVRSDQQQLGFGGEPVVCEVLLAPGEISAEDGALTDKTRGVSVLRYFFDKDGNTLYRTAGSVVVNIARRLRIRTGSDCEVLGKGNFIVDYDGTGRINADGGLDVTASVIRLNGGTRPVATVGSVVSVVVTAPIPIVVTVGGVPSPGVISVGSTFTGLVMTGNPTVLA